MKKFFYFLLLPSIFSCTSIKVNQRHLGETYDLIGKVKKIEKCIFYYPISNNDTIIREEKNIMYYDPKNRIVKQTDYHLNFIIETTFNYKNKLLENKISKIDTIIRKTEYKYDNNNNIAEYIESKNGIVNFIKKVFYDNQNNPTEMTYFHPNNEQYNSLEKFIYDSFHVIPFDENNKPLKFYNTYHFNKKGSVIKTELIRPENIDYSSKSIIEYDKRENLLKRVNFASKGFRNNILEYQNSYDEKGNIILIEKYFNQKLAEKSTINITYR